MKRKTLLAVCLGVLAATPAFADINVGVIASLTGPAAALGAETRKAVALIPHAVDGQKVNVIMLDDGSDPSNAVKDVRQLIASDKVDAILGPNLITTAMAVADIANDGKTPMVSVAPLDVSGPRRAFVFRTEPSADLMVQRIVADMGEHGVHKVGYIGFSDAWGDILSKALVKAGAGKISILDQERFARTDTSVLAQVLKVMAAKPDAVFIGGSGTAAALPEITLRDHGYKGLIYQSHGVAAREFLKVGGKAVEGTRLPVGPVLVADQLPANHETVKEGAAFMHAVEARNGPGSCTTIAGATWDAWLLVSHAVTVAEHGGAKPGTPQFRTALRDAIEHTSHLTGSNGVYTMTPNDHAGYDPAAIVMVTIDHGRWTLSK